MSIASRLLARETKTIGSFTLPTVLVTAAVSSLCLALTPAAMAAACANEAFRTGQSAALPDCRAYEMVSPPDKNGGEVDGGLFRAGNIAPELAPPEQAAASGEAVTYASTSAFVDVDSASAVASSQYVSRRTSTGWDTRGAVPAQQMPGGHINLFDSQSPDFDLFQGFSEDLDHGFLLAWNPQPDIAGPPGYFNPYLFEGEDSSYRVLSTVTPPSWPVGPVDLWNEGFGTRYAGMSADGRHVFFEANDALTARAIPGRVNLYEWSAGSPLELVSVLPEGTVDTFGGKYVLQSNMRFRWVSRDGLRAFWTEGGMSGGQLFMHEGSGSSARTVEVSASQNPAVSTGSQPASFAAENSTGSRVYFISGAQLSEGSTAGGAGKEDLYEYEVESGTLRDLTIDANPSESAEVRGVLGAGEAGGVPYVYFVAKGVLASGATTGANNIYVWRGDLNAPTFVATLGGVEAETDDFEAEVMNRTSRVSPDGRLLAFQSAEQLTAYDNRPASGQNCPAPVREGSNHLHYDGTREGRCFEVYEYDASSGQLVCASCSPSGLRPVADSLIPETLHQLGNIYGWESSTVQQRYLLDDGRLFFESEDALLDQATNGRQNIYEFEPDGVGQCVVSGVGGCLYLISTGTAEADSFFADASENGRDVFVLTDQQLVSMDGDRATDVYDAREGGGFSSTSPPPCSGEACKAPIASAPAIYGAPASATFQGLSNPTVQTGREGTVKRIKAPVRKRKHDKRKQRRKGRRARHSAQGSARRGGRGIVISGRGA